MAFRNILVFGAGSKYIGHHIVQALVADDAFCATVLARQSSKTTYPPSVKVVRVPDDFPRDELVQALKGQDIVIIATGVTAHDVQYKVIDAAVEAGVQRFIPSEWGMDNGDVNNQGLCPVFKMKAEVAEYLQSKESTDFSWTAVANGSWLDWDLEANAIDINPVAHSVEYWQGGSHPFSCTTVPYTAEATLAILKHPEVTKSKRIFLSPFEATQKEVVAELERQQHATYTVSGVDDSATVKEAKKQWNEKGDYNAAYRLVTAGVLLSEYLAGFASARKEPILEDVVDMAKLRLEDVVREWVEANPATVNA